LKFCKNFRGEMMWRWLSKIVSGLKNG
jgi:hypothetical protein